MVLLTVILPRVLADDTVAQEDIIELGHGGLCLNCGGCLHKSFEQSE